MKTYLVMPFNNEALNIKNIYFTDLFLSKDVKNPATQALFTQEEKDALQAVDLKAGDNACIAMDSYDGTTLWFDEEASKKIVLHTDALKIVGNTIVTGDNEVVATAL